MIRVVVLGLGNVGTHLSTAFVKSDLVQLVQVYNRSARPVEDALYRIPFTNKLHDLADADVYLLCISDDQIHEVATQLSKVDGLIAHTSGTVAMEQIPRRSRRGVFYPLQSFSKGIDIDFSKVPVCIEAEEDDDLKLLSQLGNSLSDQVVAISSEQRKKLHLGAVISNNFVNYLYQVAAAYLEENELDFQLLQPLIEETARKLNDLSPLEAQTGPAKRNDQQTIKNHLHLLSDSPHQHLYELMTDAIRTTYGKKL